jgi:Tol biopolymer transport system component
VGLVCTPDGKWPKSVRQGNDAAPILPDLQNITIPLNIAPLNLKILRPAIHYRVVLTPREGHPLVIESVAPSIVFPEKKWKKMLGRNAGRDLVLTLSIKEKNGSYHCFAPCTLHIATEPVDPYIAYRVIKPIYNWWSNVGIYARDLTTFDQREIIDGERFENGCVNCHSFCNNDPKHFIVSARSKKFGNACIFVVNNRAFKQNSKFGYSSWHPSGKIIVFSNMQVNQFFHTVRSEIRDVVDMYSYLACFDTQKHAIRKIENLLNPRELQTYPAWSPDGKTLYFCTAPVLWDNCDTIPPQQYSKVRYSLQKISYDVSSDMWGKPRMVLSSDSTGLSIVMPRVSPDGKFLIFCMCDYGVFPAFQKSSDIYCMDLATGDYRKLDCNSGESESWHAWSSNSRWIAFSSKRADGVFTRIYLCYIDKSGKSGKPFVLPQEDPFFYDSFMKTYSVPEFLTGPPIVRPEEIGRAERTVSAAADAKTSATLRSDTSASPHQ